MLTHAFIIIITTVNGSIKFMRNIRQPDTFVRKFWWQPNDKQHYNVPHAKIHLKRERRRYTSLDCYRETVHTKKPFVMGDTQG